MIWFKKCPRCSGDLYDGSDRYGSFITCIQCGVCLDLAQGKVMSNGATAAVVDG